MHLRKQSTLASPYLLPWEGHSRYNFSSCAAERPSSIANDTFTLCGLVTPYGIGGLVQVNGMLSVPRQTITWNNADLWSMKSLGRSHWNLNENTNVFMEENAFDDAVCKMSVTSFRPQWVVVVFSRMRKCTLWGNYHWILFSESFYDKAASINGIQCSMWQLII